MSLLEKQFSKDCYTAVYMVGEEFHNIRLDQFLLNHYSNFSRQVLKKKIYDGEVTIKGRENKLRPSTKVHYRDIITFYIYNTVHEHEYWRNKLIELELEPPLVYEDKDILVISKPPFMATHPTGRHLFNCATVYFEGKFKSTVHSIHRIDRETSGVLLLGKNPKSASFLTTEFEEGRVKKAYFFIAKSNLNKPLFEANERLGGEAEGLERVYVIPYPENSEEGKRAKTFFKILHQENGYSLGLAFPVTGRQHQIRVHAMAHGFPLIGDKLYLGSYPLFQKFKDNLATEEDFDFMELPRHALHSIALNINYLGVRKTFTAPIAKDLSDWIEAKLSVDLNSLKQDISNSLEEYFNPCI